MNWTDEKVENLKKLWAEGISAKAIGETIGFSRSAILGKVHRLKLATRRVEAHGPRKNKPRTTTNNINTVRNIERRFSATCEELPPPPPVRPDFLGLDIFKLKEGQCRYPRGERAPYLFCGQPGQEGSSYCAYCHSLTHTKITGPVRKIGVPV